MSEQPEHTHDLFISYTTADRAWVEGYLLNALTQAGVRCHSEAAFALGAPRLLEFGRAVQEGQRLGIHARIWLDMTDDDEFETDVARLVYELRQSPDTWGEPLHAANFRLPDRPIAFERV